MKFGVDGIGSSSGFGPEITPYNKNLFNTGVDVQIPLLVTYKMYHSARFQVGVPLASGGALGTSSPGDHRWILLKGF